MIYGWNEYAIGGGIPSKKLVIMPPAQQETRYPAIYGPQGNFEYVPSPAFLARVWYTKEIRAAWRVGAQRYGKYVGCTTLVERNFRASEVEMRRLSMVDVKIR